MKILIAVDGSEFSHEAVKFLAGFPFAEAPEVLLVHAPFLPLLTGYADTAGADLGRLYQQIRDEGRELLEAAEASCRPWAKSIDICLNEGPPAAEILKVARDQNVDLIVLGSRGKGALSRFLLGTVSEKVALYARCSVLIVRPPARPGHLVAENILVADDASSEVSAAIDLFSELPLTAARHVCVLGVLESSPYRGLEQLIENNPFWKAQAKTLQDHLNSAEKKFAATQVGLDVRLQKSQHIANEILETVAETNTDLLVVGSAGKNAIERVLLGSVSTRLLRHAHCSVWVHRVPQLHSAEWTLP